MATTMIEELAEDPRLLYRYTVDEYHRMIPNGIIEEGAPFELLDGHVVRKIRNATGKDPMTVGLEHILVVQMLADFNEQLKAAGCHVRVQQPVTFPLYDEPEPDAAIVQGTLLDYADHNPGPDEILCLIEVADASLRRDRGYKRQLYAGSGVAMYVIINLIDRNIEVYTRPQKGKKRYGHMASFNRNDILALPAARGKGLAVPVNQLLRRTDRTTR